MVSCKVLASVSIPTAVESIISELTTLCNSKTFVLVCGRCTMTLWGLCWDHAGCGAFNWLYSCQSSKHICCTCLHTRSDLQMLQKSRLSLTGDLNVFVYWSPPTTQFSTMWSHPAWETQKVFCCKSNPPAPPYHLSKWNATAVFVCFILFSLYAVQTDAKINPPIFFPLNHSVL